MSKPKKKLMGHIGVDSGMVWIGDPCYILSEDELDGMTYDDVCDGMGEKAFQSFKYQLGHEGLGVCARNPMGDGTYPVYGIFDGDNDAPSQIIIDFMGDDEHN